MAHSAHPSVFPFQNFQTADGWIVVACPKQKFWERFCEAIGRRDLAEDSRYAHFDGRRLHRNHLESVAAEALRAKTSQEWLRILSDAGVPCGPVNSIPEALVEPHAAARDMLVEYEHPVFGEVRSLASPVKVGPEPPPVRRAPKRNEDAPAVLRDLLHYDDARIADLRESGAFGQAETEDALKAR